MLAPDGEAIDRITAHLDALEWQQTADVRTRLEAAVEIEHDAEAAGATELAMRARLVRADMLHRAGHSTTAAGMAIEEFLVLLPGPEGDPAGATLEAMRAAVETYDWSAMAEGLRVTVSIGATRARPEDAAADVVSRADAQLYAAKRAGRNRLSLDRPLAGRGTGKGGRHGAGRRK